MTATIEKVIKRNGSIVEYDKEKIVHAIFKAAQSVGGSDRKLAESIATKVTNTVAKLYPQPQVPTVEEVQDIIEKELIEHGHAKTAKAFILYRAEHQMMRDTRDANFATSENIPYKKIWQLLVWSVDNKAYSIEALNEKVRSKHEFVKLIEATEEAYHQDIAMAAEKILKKPKTRIVIIAGPSSSGKTTSTIKIGEKLGEKGLDLVAMNLDNYFFDLEMHPKDEFGDYDFETPQALDLKLINSHLADLLDGKTIQQPIYNFKTGKRETETVPLKLESNQMLLLDSLHGLYDEMTSSVGEDYKFKLYIETLSQIKDNHNNFLRWTDIRILRRMVRDSWHRSYDPKRTIEHWHYVRRSELKHIIPFIGTVDHILNGYLAYELPIHKKYMFKYFPEFVKEYKDNPKKQDAYIRAQRIYDFLSTVKEWDDESVIPKNSLMREYIGGSIYKY
ncbi:MAG TPA: ATP cone domain-containing protein [Candidatus Wallbacteria bacterium]|nr:MAG: Uridine kinase [bacterium ADurb.Bin243]HPG56775.1 ATP cone domain-containing protein [Candidatus Wallbacteria bacterium]